MSEKIKILHVVVDMGHGGYENFIMNIYRHIDRTKYEFDFLTFKEHEAYFEKEIISLGGKVFHVPMEKKSNIFKARKIIKKIANENHFDILHCHNIYYGILYMPYFKKTVDNIIIHAHSANREKTAKGFMVWLLNQYVSKKKYHNLACSQIAGEFLFGKNGKFELCPNCVDSKKFLFDKSAASKLKEQYGIKESTYVLGHIGRFAPVKNHGFLLETIKKLRKAGHDVCLCLCGVGALKEKIVQEVKNDSLLSNSVIFLEPGDSAKYYSMFDAFVLPSQFEGFPLVLLESQASGAYSLVSDKVTDEAKLTNIIEYMPIDSINPWAKRIEGLINSDKYDRTSPNKIIENSIYDVKNTTKFLSEYYDKLVADNKNK